MTNPYTAHVAQMLGTVGWSRAKEILSKVVRDFEQDAICNSETGKDLEKLYVARAARLVQAKFLQSIETESQSPEQIGDVNE